MEAKARLLCKSYLTHFQTFIPVYFYGTPGAKVYCVYAHFSKYEKSVTTLDVIFLQHEDYSYNYKLDLILDSQSNIIMLEDFRNEVNRPGKPYTTIKKYEDFKSYAEVQKFLDEMVLDKLEELELENA